MNPPTVTVTAVTAAAPTDTYRSLNSELFQRDALGKLQLHKDHEAAKAYFDEHVDDMTRYFHGGLEEKLEWLVAHEYYESEFLEAYSIEFIKALFKRMYAVKFRFSSYMGAKKFYESYALKNNEGTKYLERYEDRIAITALYLAHQESEDKRESRARVWADEMISGRYQPATPTFLNAGRKQRGELVSCMLLEVEDNLNSIARAKSGALFLSAGGAGVAFNLTSVRAAGDPIRKVLNRSGGVLPIMKSFETIFAYADQGGQRQGAGAVYLQAHHPDIIDFLDCKREAVPESQRINDLNLGVIVPQITFDLAERDEDMYLFSPHDVAKRYGIPFSRVNVTEKYYEMVEDSSIRKTKIKARAFFEEIAAVATESGYPYMMLIDNVNKQNRVPGYITQSNLCTEIFQPSEPSVVGADMQYTEMGKDISCNLGSLNIAKVMDGKNLSRTVDAAIRSLTAVSDMSNIEGAPSIAAGNARSHAVGLGAMNFHGYIAREGIDYASPEAVDFSFSYFATITYHAMWASARIAKERGETFEGFAESKYASGEFFEPYIEGVYQLAQTKAVRRLFEGHTLPGPADWKRLASFVRQHGMYNQNLQAVAPTGSISYVNHSTSSIHPIIDQVEVRKEGKIGRVYVPAPYLTNENEHLFRSAYEIGWKALIDVYAAATVHIDQGASMTLYFPPKTTTREINRAMAYANYKGIKSIYYVRVQNATTIEGMASADIDGCVACAV